MLPRSHIIKLAIIGQLLATSSYAVAAQADGTVPPSAQRYMLSMRDQRIPMLRGQSDFAVEVITKSSSM